MGPLLIQLAVVLVLLAAGFSIGTLVERRHFRRLERREAALRHILVTDTRTLPPGCQRKPFGMVTGEVVVSADYFKTFAAQLKKIIGGELRTYETLMERARREALVRAMEAAQRMGANCVVNVRFATSIIGSLQRHGRAAMVEMYAYGTALCVSNDSADPA